jgi:pimeloyl-ACP methyl ester carboxylesterase
MMWRWLKRIGLGACALVVVVLLLGAGYEQYMRWHAARRYPPMGRLVDVGGGRRLQIDCRGSGTPTVVLESGLDNLGSLSWAAVHDSIAKTTRTCAYSRAGILWSDPSHGPFDPRGTARDLHTALSAAGEHPPFVMAGHSLGGPYIMIFTSMYPADVAGLVFVDASHPDQMEREQHVLGNAVGRPPSPLTVTAFTALSWTGFERFLPIGNEGLPLTRAVSNAYIGTSLAPVLREGTGLAITLHTAGQFRDLGDRPLVVLTGTKPYAAWQLKAAGLTSDQGRRLAVLWRSLHDDEATWSHRSRHQLVPDASHYIQFDDPNAVIAAVREVISETAK